MAPQYVDAYLNALRSLDFLEAVYLDLSPGISIYTVYRGDFESVAGSLFDAEIAAIDCFPDVSANFATADIENWDAVVPVSAQRVFPTA